MPEYREATPIAGPEAFRSTGRDAELSQAAIVLSAGAAVGGQADRNDQPEALDLPTDLRRIGRPDKFRVAQASAGLDLDLRTHLTDRALRLPASISADLTRQLIDRPTDTTAAALVEANLHSDSLLVRTAAAVAALDTTGPRDDVLDRLVEAARSRDGLTREIGRIGVARVAPQHPVLRRLVVQPGPHAAAAAAPAAARGGAVLTHGTFAATTTWWKPGGTLYTYLDALTPALHLHNPSFGWSGQYSDGARQLAAQQLVDWLAGLGVHTPDMFAHSHGGTVANLATRRGQQFDRMVLMSWPVHGEWFPDFTKLRIVVDIRVNLDLVILADRGGQTYVPPAAFRSKVVSHINGWFNHSDTNTPAYWEKYGLPAAIKV
jgi:hypothetical protein